MHTARVPDAGLASVSFAYQSARECHLHEPGASRRACLQSFSPTEPLKRVPLFRPKPLAERLGMRMLLWRWPTDHPERIGILHFRQQGLDRATLSKVVLHKRREAQRNTVA